MTWKNDQVSEQETAKILELARSVFDVPGDYVEFGCYAGDTSLLIAEELVKHSQHVLRTAAPKPLWPSLHVPQDTPRAFHQLYLYDSFEGLPEKSSQDASDAGRDFVKGALAVSKKDVKARFLRAGLMVPVIKKAWFNELTSEDVPDKIAFAFLDGDLYESIRDSLRLVEGKMAEKAVIIVHDYANPALPGVAKAVDEWMIKSDYKMTQYQSMAIVRR